MISANSPGETVYFWMEKRESDPIIKHRCKSRDDQTMSIGSTCEYCGTELTLAIAQDCYNEGIADCTAAIPV